MSAAPKPLAEETPDFPWFPLFVDDWLNSEKVSLMTFAAQGAYVRLLCHQWRNGSIPEDLRQVARLVGTSLVEMTELWTELDPLFPIIGEGRRQNARLAQEYGTQTEKAVIRKEKSKKAAEVRWKGKDGQVELQVEEGGLAATGAPSNAPSTDGANLAQCHLDEDGEVDADKEAKASSGVRLTRAQYLFKLLPETHRTAEMEEALAGYFRMRTEARMKTLTPGTIEERAAEYGSYPVSSVVEALKESKRQQWQGVFPHKHNGGAKVSKETIAEKVARIRKELHGEAA